MQTLIQTHLPIQTLLQDQLALKEAILINLIIDVIVVQKQLLLILYPKDVNVQYLPLIGLEIHAQALTSTPI